MKKKFWLCGLAVLVGWLTLVSAANTEEVESSCWTSGKGGTGLVSPYFFVKSDDPTVDPFPLLEARVKVNIAGVIAEVELVQVYKNEGRRTIEAVYVFPLGTRAAIHRMHMKIGERLVDAKIEERQTAQDIYNQAKQDGKITSLLQQQRPNVFQMNVANIMPQDIVEVTVGYTELLIPEDGTYEYVYPTVVGPRYGGEVTNPQDTDQFINTPYLHAGEDPTYNFDIRVNLNSAVPIAKIWVPSHNAEIIYNAKKAEVKLAADETKGGNRDFILRYTLQGKRIQTGLLLYPGEKENFFLLMAQPPKNISLKDIPPREYVFIVDVSGSMHGFPLNVSKALMSDVINNLREKDYFNILFFSGGSKVLSPTPLAATPENKARAIQMLQAQSGGGGTNLLAALKQAMSLEKKEGLSRVITIATDGYVGVEKQSFDLIRDNLSEANVFAFGIGSSVNRYIIEGMARAGRGEPFVAINEKEAKEAAKRFANYVKSPLLTDVELTFKDFQAYDVEPISIPDLFAQRPLIIYGKYKQARGKIIIMGKTAQRDYYEEVKVVAGLQSKENVALKYLWARERIARLSDYARVGADTKEEVTNLGLEYSLITEFTSFVAVDTVVRDTGEVITVKQPLPLPQGVSDYAVGGTDKLSYKSGCLCREEAYATLSGIAKDQDKKSINVYLSGGKFPKGFTIRDAEKLLEPLKKKLGELFKEWELREIVLELTVEKGQIKGLKVVSYKGKGYEEKKLASLLTGLNFSRNATGTLQVNLIAR